MKRNYKNKPVNFKLDEPDDVALYEELQKLPHKKFTEETKAYWRKRLKIKNEFNIKENEHETN